MASGSERTSRSQSREFGVEQPSTSPRHSPSRSPRTSPERNIDQMIIKSIKALKQPDGCGLAQIKKYLSSRFKVNTVSETARIKKFLKKATDDGTLSQAKGKYKLQRRRRKKKTDGKKKTGARRRRNDRAKKGKKGGKKGKKGAKKKGHSRRKKKGARKNYKKAKKGRGRRGKRGRK